MPFLRTDDNYSEDDRFEAVSFEARWLHFAALEYCARKLKDGHVSKTISGRNVVLAFRLSGVEADFPNVATQQFYIWFVWQGGSGGNMMKWAMLMMALAVAVMVVVVLFRK